MLNYKLNEVIDVSLLSLATLGVLDSKDPRMIETAQLTNAFSKKIDNHMYSIALSFMLYNFCRIHKTLRVTPAMETGVTDHVWDLE